MSWPQWEPPVHQQAIPSLLNTPPPLLAQAPATTVLAPPPVNTQQYTQEQWQQIQQQNWHQWAQWQQQYQQWHQQYGAEYQKSMNVLTVNIGVPPPPLPTTETKPPLPDEPPPPSTTTITTATTTTTNPGYSTLPVASTSWSQPPPKFNQQKSFSQQQKNFNNQPKSDYTQQQKNFNNQQNIDFTQPKNYNQVNPDFNQQKPDFNQQKSDYNQLKNYNQPDYNQQKNFSQAKTDFNQPKPDFSQQKSDYNQQKNYNQTKSDFNQQKSNYNQQKNYQQKTFSQIKPETNQRFDQNKRRLEQSPDNYSNKKKVNQSFINNNSNIQAQKSPQQKEINLEELSEAEKKFDKQFADWELQFSKWKEQNAEHPDKEQYKEYEKKWEQWRAQLLERRKQMKNKRLEAQKLKQQTLNLNNNNEKLNLTINELQFTKPPPNLNNEPLNFRNNTNSNDNGDFLKSTDLNLNEGGIPGLDLVKDNMEETDKKNDDVVIIDNVDKKTNQLNKNLPDFDAISKNINTILGDQKLLNMLSIVTSQQSKIDNPVMTNFDDKSNLSQEEQSNHSNKQDCSHQREFVHNFDDQTRSSFTYKNEYDNRNFSNYEQFDENCDRPNQFKGNFDRQSQFKENFDCQSQFQENFDRQSQFKENFDRQSQFKENFERPSQFKDNFEHPNQFKDNFNGPNQFKDNFDCPNQFKDNFDHQNQFERSKKQLGDQFSDNFDQNQFNSDNFNSRQFNDRFMPQNRQFNDNFNNFPSYEDDYDDNFNNDNFNDDNYDNYYDTEQDMDENCENVPPPPPEVQEEENEILKPVTVVDYDHKSLKPPEPDILVEPLHTFDYRHKPLSRIPLPQRPKWLSITVRNIREFDPPLVRPYENLRRYPLQTPRIDDNWRLPRHNYNERQMSNFDNKRFDDRRVFEPKYDDRKMKESRFEFNDKYEKIDDDDDSFSDFNEDNKNDQTEFKEESKCINLNTINKNVTLIEDILYPPGRYNRPPRIVIILRGPPGSGKTFLAKLIKDKEVENGGSTPRILSLDDYFMMEQEKEVFEDGKKMKIKEMVYEYEGEMEENYRISLVKSFKKTITDGYFNFIIVDNVNDKVKYFGEMWSFAKQNGFQVYICQLEFDVQSCTKRNIHGRSELDIESCIKNWEITPSHHPLLDATSLIQCGSIMDVEMEEVNSPENDIDDNDNKSAEDQVARSKWDNFDCSHDNLAKLDGVGKPLRSSRTMEEYLQLDTEWELSRPTKPGQKRVRWADLEERKQQEKMRAIGFVVGQTNWDRMMDPTMGGSALTQTKYIEKARRF